MTLVLHMVDSAATSEKDSRVLNAEKLADEMREELPQMFDLNYEPKWDLYDEKVCFLGLHRSSYPQCV